MTAPHDMQSAITGLYATQPCPIFEPWPPKVTCRLLEAVKHGGRRICGFVFQHPSQNVCIPIYVRRRDVDLLWQLLPGAPLPADRYLVELACCSYQPSNN